MQKKLSNLTIKLPCQVHTKFKEFAVNKQQSMSALIVGFILEQLTMNGKDCPWPHIPNKRTKKILHDVKNGKEKFIRAKDTKELFKKLGL